MRHLLSRPALAVAGLLSLAAVHCSDSESPSSSVGNQQPSAGSASTAGAGGSSSNTSGSSNAGGSESSAGSSSTGGSASVAAGSGGMAGMAGMGLGGSSMTDAGVGGSALADAGVEVDSGAPEEPEEPAEPEPSGPLVALTFDDGPNVNQTPQVLDRLQEYGVPASFFLIGTNINAGAQAVLDRAIALGCEFENHSNGFDSLNNGDTQQQIADSVNTTTQLIQQFTGQTPEFFRAPNLQTSALMFQTIDLPFAGGILGNDFNDAATPETVANAILSQVQDGSIILLHDSQPQLNPHPTPAALDMIIPSLQQQGYQIVTLRRLFELRGVDPNSQQDTVWNSLPPQN